MNHTSAWEDQIIREIVPFTFEDSEKNVITDEMREGLRYCLDRLPGKYGEIFYQKYRDKNGVKFIEKTVGVSAITQRIRDGLRYLRSIENISIITLGIKEGVKRNQLVKEGIRFKLENKIYDFSDEELLYLDVKTSALPVREKNTLIRANVQYLHEIICMENPLELRGLGINQLQYLKEYTRENFGA